MSAPVDVAPGTQPAVSGREPELRAVVSDLWENSERLVQQELQLALSELDVRVDQAKRALRQGAIAGGLFHAAYLTMLATLVLLLAEVLAPWLAALLVAICAAAGAFWFSHRSKQSAQEAAAGVQESISAVSRTAHSQGATHVSTR